jgi:hypothetical protein
MLSRFIGAALVMLLIGGFVLAEKYPSASITKNDPKEGITFTALTVTADDKVLVTKTIKLGKGVKLLQGDKPLGTKAFDELVKKYAEGKGLKASITTDGKGKGEIVTKIQVKG